MGLPASLARLVIRRFTALLLPLDVIAIAMLWFPNVDEDSLVAMVVSLFAGSLIGRMYEQAPGKNAASAGTTNARANRWPTLRPLVKRVVTREGVDKVLDYVRFRIDTFPHGIYQPVASLPIRNATRGTGSESRWEAMFPVVGEQAVKSAVDIGACEGYFSIKLGSARIQTIALEGYPAIYRTAQYAIRRSGLDNVGVLALELNPDNIFAVPAADAVLCLSVWHHLVRDQGLAGATEMLKTIWDPDQQGPLLRHRRERDDARLRAPGDDAGRPLVARRLPRGHVSRLACRASRHARGVRPGGPDRRAKSVRRHPRLAGLPASAASSWVAVCGISD